MESVKVVKKLIRIMFSTEGFLYYIYGMLK